MADALAQSRSVTGYGVVGLSYRLIAIIVAECFIDAMMA
jgi:hypothetical protein